MRVLAIAAGLAVALLFAASCKPQPVFYYTRPAEPDPVVAQAAPSERLCWDEPQFEMRYQAAPGELVLPICPTCEDLMVCQAGLLADDPPRDCRALAGTELAHWREQHEQRVQVDVIQRCGTREEAQTAEAVRGALNVVAEEPAPYPAILRPGGSDHSYTGGAGRVHVRGYHRRDGTYVRPHTRSRPRRR